MWLLELFGAIGCLAASSIIAHTFIWAFKYDDVREDYD